MIPILSLWMPVLLAAVLVFVGSSVIHMFLTYHRNDYQALPDEAGVMDALRPFAIPPGDYLMPFSSGSEEIPCISSSRPPAMRNCACAE